MHPGCAWRRVLSGVLSAALLALVLADGSDAGAALVRPMNLERLVAQAGHIFGGRCVRVRVEHDRTLGQTVSLVTLVPDRVVKGPHADHGSVTIRLLGDVSPAARPGEETEGLPRFEPGERVVLFLYPESQIGLTSPIGLGQGKFRVRPDRSGRPVAENHLRNRGLLEGLSPGAAARLGARAAGLDAGRGIAPDALLDMAQELAR